MISDPSTAQYRTVPWRPSNVTFDLNSIGPDTFEVRWSGPTQATEFDRYQVSYDMHKRGNHCSTVLNFLNILDGVLNLGV